MEASNRDYNDLKKDFINIKNEYRTVPFLHMDGDISNEEEIGNLFASYKKSGYGGLTLLPVSETIPKFNTEEYYNAYGKVLEKAKKLGMSVIYYDDLDFPTGHIGGELAEKYPQALAKQLCRKIYSCSENEKVKIKLVVDGTVLSVIAQEEESRNIIDLRTKIITENNTSYIVWDTPEGNWNIEQYYCTAVAGEKYVNYLDYDSCKMFINLTYKRFTDMFSEYIGNTVNITFYDDIQFRTQNRRMWDDNFNKIFEEKFGFDPAPYYPMIFNEIDEDYDHYRALFMNCRAEMLCDGFFRAVSDFTKTHDLLCTGHVAEPKTIATPWLYGDGMLYQKYAGACGLDLVHRYMYGFNGLKIAASSSYNYDTELVLCEIYGNYSDLNEDLLYREAQNALVRGVNFFIPHTLWLSGVARIPHEVSSRNPKFKDLIKPWNDFAARACTLLRGGRHICDIAILYPIYSLQSQTTLYESPAEGFEFPRVPVNADYMNIINAVQNYCGHDTTVIHPDIMEEKCYTDEGILYLRNDINYEQYKIIIIPGSSMISVKNARLLKKYYNEGGKIIATSTLPFRAFEFNPAKKEAFSNDDEVREIIEYIFGVKQYQSDTFEQYYYNSNSAGGEAYLLLSSSTAADGTDLIDCKTLFSILDTKLNIDYDIVIEDMPRVQNTGLLNLHLPGFMSVSFKGSSGGMFNYLHKKNAGHEVIYFSNTTNTDYSGDILLNGEYKFLEEWNPYNGKIKKITFEIINKNDTVYTKFNYELKSVKSSFIIGANKQ